MDIAGRRPLLLFPMLAMILDLALMTVCLVLQVLRAVLLFCDPLSFSWSSITYCNLSVVCVSTAYVYRTANWIELTSRKLIEKFQEHEP